MTRMINRLLLILIFASIQLLLSAQQQEFHFSHFSRENGLPSDRTRCVLQDFQGYIWIGTDNGLVRYDGRNTTVFRPERGDSASVIDICIDALLETRDSMLLIGTIDGISLYDPFSKKFDGYSVYRKGNSWFPVTGIVCFHEDADGSIWIGSENGLVHMTRNPVKFSHFSLRKSEVKTDREYQFNFVTYIIQDPGDRNKLILGTLGGVLQFDKLSKTITRDYKKIINNTTDIIALNLDAGRFLWSCGWGMGLNCLDLKTGEWQEYPYNEKAPITIVDITKKSKDEFWLATISHGLGIFRKSDHTFRFIQKTSEDDKSFLPGLGKIKYLNNKKDLWILSDEGIYILDMRFQTFRNVAIPLKSNSVSSFLKISEKGPLFVGAIDSQGLLAWDERKSVWDVIPFDGNPGGNGISILTLYRDSRSVIWLGTSSGLWFLDPVCRKLRLFRNPAGSSLPLKDNRIYTIMEDDRFNLWIGTRSEGVLKIDSMRSRVIHYQHDPDDPGSIIDGGRIGTICSDKFKNIWIATDGGISIYDPVRNCFKNDIMDSLAKFGVTKRWINGVVRDTLGRMWVIVDVAGLIRIETPENGHFRFKLFNTTNGLNNTTTGRMTMDAMGGIWMINYGLLYINPYDESFHLFDEHNGLSRALSFDESLYTDADGNIYIGGKGKFEIKNIRELDFMPLTIKLLVESLEVNGKNVPLGKISDQDHPYLLSADQNNLLFRYTGICFQDVDQILFRYKMEGYDHEWIMAGTGREARYTNLPPGKYRFVFQVSNRGIWLDQESSVWFIIRPFFWKTWWFITLVIIAVAMVLYNIYRYKVRELLRLERMRARIASDLHDDVGSTLSSISILSDILAQQVENQRSAGIVNTIGANAHKMLEKIDDIIWVVNPSNDKFQNLGLRIREFAIPLFESKNIAHDIRIDKEIKMLQLTMEARRNIYLIVKEAINNAVKYSECRSVEISFSHEHSSLTMKITDDGIGFNPEGLTSRNGIKNMKIRAAQINAAIEIHSAHGSGTRITLMVDMKSI